MYINGAFNTDTQYSITILKGVKAENKEILKQDYTDTATIKDIPSNIVFSSSGVFLAKSANKKMSFKTMNIDRVKVRIARIYPNNITQFLYDTNLNSNNASYSFLSLYNFNL